ncbi:hypothetical protein SAMN02910355_2279 [Terrisporobacter glycolicus]|nr:hypothetical protein SAMN02910355_2279 [Terrisporobacter glycolicus]
MDIVEYAANEIKLMTLEQLNILKINYMQDVKRTEKQARILKLTVDDPRHPDRLRADYKYKEAKSNLSFIEMCIEAKKIRDVGK